MSVSGGILMKDLARMAREGSSAPLGGRPSTSNQVVIYDRNGNMLVTDAELAFAETHEGMSRAEWEARNSAWAKQNREADAVRGLDGDPPDSLCDVKGMSPARGKYANYFVWRQGERKGLRDLEAKKAELESIIAAPTAAETEVRNGIKRTAAKLLGRASDGGEADAGALANRLAVAQHRAEAAKLALPTVEQEIDKAKLRVAKLDERESEFLNAAIIEVADASGLGQLYLKKITELRAIAAMMFELREVVGTYGSGFSFGQETIKLPRPGLPSIKGSPDGDFHIRPENKSHVFDNIAQALRLDPKHKPHVPLPR